MHVLYVNSNITKSFTGSHYWLHVYAWTISNQQCNEFGSVLHTDSSNKLKYSTDLKIDNAYGAKKKKTKESARSIHGKSQENKTNVKTVWLEQMCKSRLARLDKTSIPPKTAVFHLPFQERDRPPYMSPKHSEHTDKGALYKNQHSSSSSPSICRLASLHWQEHVMPDWAHDKSFLEPRNAKSQLWYGNHLRGSIKNAASKNLETSQPNYVHRSVVGLDYQKYHYQAPLW